MAVEQPGNRLHRSPVRFFAIGSPSLWLMILALTLRPVCRAESHTLLEAQQAAQRKDYAAADSAYRRALASSPGSAEIMTQLGIVLQMEGKSPEAIAMFRRALKLKHSPRTYAQLAEELCRTGDLDDVRPMVAEILKQTPRETRSIAAIAPCTLAMNEPLDAITSYEWLLADPAFPTDQALVQLSKAYLIASRYYYRRLNAVAGSAVYLQSFQQARKSEGFNPQDQLSWVARQSTLVPGDFAFPELISVLKAHPEDPAVLYALFLVSEQLAAERVVACREKYPDSPYLLQLRADMLADQGKPEDAIQLYSTVLKAAPDLPNARNNFASLYDRQGDWAKSLEIYQQQLSLHPNDQRAAAGAADSLLKLGRYTELKRFLLPRVAAVRAPLWACTVLAEADEKLGNLNGAIRSLVKAERDYPSDRGLHYRLMRLYMATGDAVSAQRERESFDRLSKAAASTPQSPM